MTTPYKGDTVTLTATFTDDAGDAIDLSSYTHTALVKGYAGTATPTVDETNAATGVLSITFQTEAFGSGVARAQLRRELAGNIKYSDEYTWTINKRLET